MPIPLKISMPKDNEFFLKFQTFFDFLSTTISPGEQLNTISFVPYYLNSHNAI